MCIRDSSIAVASVKGLSCQWLPVQPVFCDLYRVWRGELDLVMRQDYRAGKKLFEDYAGMTVRIISPETNLVRDAQIFVYRTR